MVFVIAFAGFSISSLLAILLSPTLFGVGLSDIAGSPDFKDPSVMAALKFTQTMNAIGLFLVPGLVYARLMGSSVLKIYGLSKNINWRLVILIIVLVFIALPLENYLGGLNHAIPFPDSLSGLKESLLAMEKTAEETTMAFLRMDGIGDLLLSLFIMALLPAVGEELLFRGVIQKIFQEQIGKHHLAIWITAAIFSAIHMQFFGFLPRLVMGAALGYLFHWSESLIYPMLAHFLNNATAVGLAYYIGIDQIPEDIENAGADQPLVFAISLAFCLLILFRIRIGFQENKKPIT